jgi:hypothetical protein
MSRKSGLWFLSAFMLTAVVICMPLDRALGTGSTIHPWPSFRHDLLNSGAATDSGYPTTANKIWMQNREFRAYDPASRADSRGPSVVDRGMVITAGQGVIQANDQFTGSMLWHQHFLWQPPAEPAGAPTDWCYNDIPQLEGNTGVCYTTGTCPSWCFQCTSTQPDCTDFSLIAPLGFPAGYDQFIAGPTMDPT